MKIKQRLILDFALLIALWVCMEYDFTGGLLHELIGLILLAFLIFHIILNRKYYFYALNSVSGGNITKMKKSSLIVNTVLLLALIVMLISSFAISNDLLPFVSQFFGHREFWRILHISSAIVLFFTSAVHVILHKGLYYSLLKKIFKTDNSVSAYKFGLRVLAVLMLVGVVKTSVLSATHIPQIQSTAISQNGSQYQDRQDNYSQDYYSQDNSQDSSDEYVAPSTDGTPTLEEYLQSKTCSGCGRCCSLLSLHCSRGNEYKNKAVQEYNNLYS